MEPGDIEAVLVRFREMDHDLIQRQRRRVDHSRAGWSGGEDVARHERAGVEADRAALDQPQSAHRDQIGRAGAGADEMDGHWGAPSK